MLSCHIEDINKKIEIIKSNQVKILELKIILNEMKNQLEGLTADLSRQKEKINKLEHRSIEVIPSEKKDKRIK